MQLIFLIESSKESESDYRYITETINRFYIVKGIKLTRIAMNGKGNYAKQLKLVNQYVKKYNANSKTSTKVFMCYDIDNPSKSSFKINKELVNYCIKNNFETIWFNEDIEQVYIKTSISKSLKTKRANMFVSHNEIMNVEVKSLTCAKSSKTCTSNILLVLDKYLIRK